MKTLATLVVACGVALGVFSSANAQVRDENENALLLDTRGAPVMNATGLCWHTAYGPPPMWTFGCHAEGPATVALVADWPMNDSAQNIHRKQGRLGQWKARTPSRESPSNQFKETL